MKTVHIELTKTAALVVVTHENGCIEQIEMLPRAAIDCLNQWLAEGYKAV